MKPFFFFLSLLLFSGTSLAENRHHLLPVPQQVSWNEMYFPLKKVALDAQCCRAEAEEWLAEQGAAIDPSVKRKMAIRLVSSIPGITLNGEEGYRLEVTDESIRIEALTETGVFRALQTLRQLVDRKSVRGCRITDWPAFAVRGFMHDTGRGYIPVEELKREIDILSQYKVNVFHWHLTEDLGWRLESKLFPKLNDSLYFGRYPGRYYTLDEARDLVAYCKARHVTLIPEVDMPGHSLAFRKAFGTDMQSSEGTAILKKLMDEICEVFRDVPYLHIGTDEVEFTNDGFVPEMVRYIRAKGMKVISWDPGFRYETGDIDMLQMWSSWGKPHPGIPVIDSRLHYLNHFDAFADVAGLYRSNIAGQAQGSADYAGTILAVWNDRRIDGAGNVLIQNAFYPALLAMAERAWRGGGKGYFYELGASLPPAGTDEYREFADFERRMLWHKEHRFEGYPFAYVRQCGVKWRITDAFPNGGDTYASFPPEEIGEGPWTYNGKTYGARDAEGAAIYLRHVWGPLIPAFYADPQPDHTAYAYTWVYSPRRQKTGLWFCTQNYGRSESDLPPPPGLWDYCQSRIWMNGLEVMSPAWTGSHEVRDNEIPLGNENFEMRPPLPVTLEKGWNRVFIKLPVGKFSIPDIRLVKWMFTAVFVEPDGRNIPEGLIYSPDRSME